ncbi:zinc finger protein 761-like [Cydia strobilella]|uniref:zinc finger protein 761-like n=1 Tax=Cydia strobilella TaxID=1100964 RepID=UPI003004FB1E
MASDESDDEPLASIAAAKKLNPEKYSEVTIELCKDEPAQKKKKKTFPQKKMNAMTIKINRALKAVITPPVVERPIDVWLYLKDLNPTGPYSCLLCPDWFINRGKMILHYVLNHKKDYCGICRYFVPDREAWLAHLKFHVPWPCSQCVKNFDTEAELRQHFSAEHNLVHCRLCHFRVPDDDQYNTHLIQKHSVSNLSCKDEDTLWEFEYEGSNKFLCLLCSKSNNLCTMFFNHYMGYHHYTLKCLSSILSGRDLPFVISGADVSPQFIDDQLKDQSRVGYVDLQKNTDENINEDHSDNESEDLLKVLIPEIKQEAISEAEETETPSEEKPKEKIKKVRDENDIANIYKGDEDFDITLTELIILQKCYFEYVNRTLNDINSNLVPEVSDIDYATAKPDLATDITCTLCKNKYDNMQAFMTHMIKNHFMKVAPIFSCRVCTATFESQSELDSHVTEELGDFEDLWICQFCDKEFDNREDTRKHLNEHWEVMEFDNCFSPHLGFKCKYCSTLFWNETDRETHEVRTHFSQYTEQFYKCEDCSETFSDKVFYIHHYMEKHRSSDSPTYMLKCSVCCIVRPSIEEMRTHFEVKHPEARKIFCSLDSCQYRPLSHRKSFKFHLRSVHDPTVRPQRPATCTICERDFVSTRALGAHMAQVHGPGKFKCKLCREVMHTLDERKLHYLIRHPGRHPFECAECGKSFQYKSSLYMHKQEHSPIKQSFTCTYCSKVFAKRDSFREHLQIHEGPRHACSYCPMRFVQRSNMLRHERRHTGERPYACQHCPRTFSDKGACNSHSRTHSKDTSYACIYCGQTFVQKSKLTYHIRKHTGENLETCTICSKLFTSACSLREHMKIHEAKKKGAVQCPLCERKYKDERYMLRHLRTSHTSTSFPCPLCDKNLTSMAGLRHHVVTHSGLNTFRCKCCPKSYAVKRSVVKHLRKRHGLKGTEINIKDYFKRIDPRDCDLGLDDEAMTKIFGPPKKTMNDILMGDFVTLTDKLTGNQNTNNDDDDNDDTNDEDDNDGKDSDENENENVMEEISTVIIKTEKKETDELEPTNFVSVKIEPMDEEGSE